MNCHCGGDEGHITQPQLLEELLELLLELDDEELLLLLELDELLDELLLLDEELLEDDELLLGIPYQEVCK